MQLQSPAFEDGKEMAQKFGKKVENVSPPLAWTDVPAGTVSLALVLVDRDNHDYAHWILCDIPADTVGFEEGAATTGDLRGARVLKPYAGPFPPSGTHRYEFVLYALSVPKLALTGSPNAAALEAAAQPGLLAKASLSGLFTKHRG